MAYRDPDLLPADVPRLKTYTKYECPTGAGQLGHSSVWTGALGCGQGPRDHLCSCGEPYVEVVEDGNTYRVTFETIDPFMVDHWKATRDDDLYEWHTATRDSTDKGSIQRQHDQLELWAMTRVEPIRNVQMFVAATSWEPVATEDAD